MFDAELLKPQNRLPKGLSWAEATEEEFPELAPMCEKQRLIIFAHFVYCLTHKSNACYGLTVAELAWLQSGVDRLKMADPPRRKKIKKQQHAPASRALWDVQQHCCARFRMGRRKTGCLLVAVRADASQGESRREAADETPPQQHRAAFAGLLPHDHPRN